MASFVDALRMNNIFPSGDNNPFGPPNMNQGVNLDEISNIMNRITPYAANENQKNRDFQEHMFNVQRQGHLQDIAQQLHNQPPIPPMNVIERPDPNLMKQPTEISPIQQAELGVRKQQATNKSNLDYAKLAQGEEKISQGEEKVSISKDRANVYQFKATHPGMKIMMPEGGNITAVDPITGKTMDLGISTGKMSQEDRINLVGEQKMEQIGAQDQNQQNIQQIRGKQGLEQIGARITGQQQLQEAKPIKEMLPTQIKVQQNNAARQLMNIRPDLAQYITYDSTTGNFNVIAPSEGFFGHSGPTKEQYDEINKILYNPTKPETKPVVKSKPAIPSNKVIQPKVIQPTANDPLGIR
jgi:hypothetical protein